MRKNQKYTVIHKDENILVVNKSSGLSVTGDRWDFQALRLDKILENDFACKIFTVHRIDKDTSGIIVFALNESYHKYLNIEFQERRVQKVYHAIVCGKPAESFFSVDLKLTPDGGKQHETIVDMKKGKIALTNFKVLETFGRFSFLEAMPVTGRTHQIRVHLAASGLPILCDSLYGKSGEFFLSSEKRSWRGNRFEEHPLLNRLALHACSLKFTLPDIKTEVEFSAPYPKDFKSVLNQLRNI